ncbi:hypothetical protein EV147_0531 [Cupriavidus agavae]|uniref:Acyltransferase 3 domain-containing protein n=2 Tax=Cupriavidus agavae TaxID=1001822 RepID=A0A4Q7S6P7_9BURK|nr:hypothetical protein EV147_0531 [Cupriavidus agavae]
MPTAEAIFRPGALGVDLFFLISGFIMVYTTMDCDGSFTYAARFWIKRLSRIWPVYVVLAIIGVQAYNLITVYADASLWVKMIKSFFFLPVDPYQPLYYGLPYGLGWTLNFEVYFYLVFGLSMLAGRRWRWLVFFGWIGFTLIALPLLTRGMVTLDVQHDYHYRISYLNQVVNPIIWTFALGVIAGLVYLSPIQMPDSMATRLFVVSAVTTAVWWAYSGMAMFHGIGEWGGPLAVAFVILAIATKTVELRIPSQLLWLGEVSFSLYLVHPIAQALITRTLNGIGRKDLTQTWSHVFATTIFALVLAAISHKLLEQRLAEYIKNKMLRAVRANQTISYPTPA